MIFDPLRRQTLNDILTVRWAVAAAGQAVGHVRVKSRIAIGILRRRLLGYFLPPKSDKDKVYIK